MAQVHTWSYGATKLKYFFDAIGIPGIQLLYAQHYYHFLV